MTDTLRIGPYKFTIERIDDKQADELGVDGDCSMDQQRIRIREDQPASLELDTMLHEVLHAVWRTWHLYESDTEERIVSVLATGLTQLMIANPESVEYLAAMVGECNE